MNNYFHIGVDKDTNLCYTVYVINEKGLNNMTPTDRYEPLGLALGQKLMFIHKDNIDSVPLGLIGVIKEIVCTDKLKKKFSYVEVESENGLRHFLTPNPGTGEWESLTEY